MATVSDSMLLRLPDELLENILSFINFEEVSHCRAVCKVFEKICERLLNRGFQRVDQFHVIIQKEVKMKLPRRESERRNHPLARHVDILAAIETRLSLLNMTFIKYIELQLCCFIPGKVLDELYDVLRYIRSTTKPPRAHELLQELRDISSMAMEHFDEHIVPMLKARMHASSALTSTPVINCQPPLHQPSTSLHAGASTSKVPSADSSLTQELLHSRVTNRMMTSNVTSLKKELIDCKSRLSLQRKETAEQNKQLLEQAKVIAELNKLKSEQDQRINELAHKLLNCERQCASLDSTVSELCRAIGLSPHCSASPQVEEECTRVTRKRTSVSSDTGKPAKLSKS